MYCARMRAGSSSWGRNDATKGSKEVLGVIDMQVCIYASLCMIVDVFVCMYLCVCVCICIHEEVLGVIDMQAYICVSLHDC